MNDQFWGFVPFEQGLAYQKDCLLQVETNPSQVFVGGFEHPLTITLGLRGDAAVDVFAPQVPVLKLDRGGQATLHSPGQLVIYPVLSLEYYKISVPCYVRLLEKTTQKVLAEQFQIQTELISGRPGVFLSNKSKIAFCGVKITKGIAQHGISLNINNDLNKFQLIRPCGLAGQTITSIQQITNQKPPLETVFLSWVQGFKVELASLTQGANSCDQGSFERVSDSI